MAQFETVELMVSLFKYSIENIKISEEKIVPKLSPLFKLIKIEKDRTNQIKNMLERLDVLLENQKIPKAPRKLIRESRLQLENVHLFSVKLLQKYNKMLYKLFLTCVVNDLSDDVKNLFDIEDIDFPSEMQSVVETIKSVEVESNYKYNNLFNNTEMTVEYCETMVKEEKWKI
jgi:hypothetical protein